MSNKTIVLVDDPDPDGTIIAHTAQKIDRILDQANIPGKWIAIGQELKRLQQELKDKKRWKKALTEKPRVLQYGETASYSLIEIATFFEVRTISANLLPTSITALKIIAQHFPGKETLLEECLADGRVSRGMTGPEVKAAVKALDVAKIPKLTKSGQPKKRSKPKLVIDNDQPKQLPSPTGEVTPVMWATYVREAVPDNGRLNRALELLLDLEINCGGREALSGVVLKLISFIDTSDPTLSKGRRLLQLSDYLKQSKGEKE